MITQLIAEREEKMNHHSTSYTRKLKLEWDIRQLREDIQRWTQTIEQIDKTLDELEGTAPSSVVKFKI